MRGPGVPPDAPRPALPRAPPEDNRVCLRVPAGEWRRQQEGGEGGGGQGRRRAGRAATSARQRRHHRLDADARGQRGRWAQRGHARTGSRLFVASAG
jgi:hypothetical protein